jgi:hypothetical protein
MGDNSNIYTLENKETHERREVNAYSKEEAGRKISKGRFSD